MRRLLAASVLASVTVVGSLYPTPVANAKAQLTTVSNQTLEAPVSAVYNKKGTLPVVVHVEIPVKKTNKSETPKPIVIKDIKVEKERAAKRAAHIAVKKKAAVVKKTNKSVRYTATKKDYSNKRSTSVRATLGKTSGYNWATPGQCTWGAQIKWKQATGSYLGGFYGNALTWGYRAANAGYSVGTTPRARSVVVMQPGVHGSSYAGHVAWVTRVSGNKVTYVEMNGSAGPYNWSTRTVSHTGGMQYIYAP